MDGEKINKSKLAEKQDNQCPYCKKDLEKAEEVLGGDASDFFDALGVGTSLNEAQMQAQT